MDILLQIGRRKEVPGGGELVGIQVLEILILGEVL
jgi:hypothetical protein